MVVVGVCVSEVRNTPAILFCWSTNLQHQWKESYRRKSETLTCNLHFENVLLKYLHLIFMSFPGALPHCFLSRSWFLLLSKQWVLEKCLECDLEGETWQCRSNECFTREYLDSGKYFTHNFWYCCCVLFSRFLLSLAVSGSLSFLNMEGMTWNSWSVGIINLE